MKFTAIGRTMGDETTPYAVSEYKSKTVGEFINEVLTERPYEWGAFAVKEPGMGFLGSPRIKYRYGKLLDEIPAEWQNLVIKHIEACGGWTAMDYLIWEVNSPDTFQ